MMTTWPVYRILFIEGTVIEIASSGIGSAMVDACVVANELQDTTVFLPARSSLRIQDIVEIKQLAPVYISPSVLEVNGPDVYDLTRRGPHDSN
jgi:hypothetical protein